MQATQPLVSICIPTYNRSACLKQTLDSILPQKEFVDGRVEVVINDNASTDDTEVVSKPYTTRYSNIHYFKNPENLLDRNYPITFSRATGKLRKLNNDTAVLLPGALKYLCDMEQKYEDTRPVMFFSNGKTSPHSKEQITDQVLDFQAFIRTISYWITWIGSFSLWDSDCKDIETDFDGCELRLWQVKKLCENGSKKNAIAVCNKQIITSIAPPKKDISYGLYQVFYENYFKIIDPYVERGVLQKDDRDFLEKDLLLNFFPDWIIQWEMNNQKLQYSESENLLQTVYDHYKNKPYWNEYLKIHKRRKLQLKIKNFAKNVLEKKGK